MWKWGFDTKRYEIYAEKGKVTKVRGSIVEAEEKEEAEAEVLEAKTVEAEVEEEETVDAKGNPPSTDC